MVYAPGVGYFIKFNDLNPLGRNQCIFYTQVARPDPRCLNLCWDQSRAIELHRRITQSDTENIFLSDVIEYVLCNCCTRAKAFHRDKIENIGLLVPLAQRWLNEIRAQRQSDAIRRQATARSIAATPAPASWASSPASYTYASSATSTPSRDTTIGTPLTSPSYYRSDSQSRFSANAGFSKPDASPTPASRNYTTSTTTQTRPQASETQTGYNLRSRQVEDAAVIARYSLSSQSEFQPHVSQPTFKDTVEWQICEPLGERDDETGWVYIYNRASSPGYVKIGWTARSVEDRLDGWSKCGYVPNELFRARGVPNAQRAETLTHYELIKEWRRERRCKVHPHTSHQEWFEVSQERAIQVLGDWAEFFKKTEPYERTGYLKAEWRNVVDRLRAKGEVVTSAKLLEIYKVYVKKKADAIQEPVRVASLPKVVVEERSVPVPSKQEAPMSFKASMQLERKARMEQSPELQKIEILASPTPVARVSRTEAKEQPKTEVVSKAPANNAPFTFTAGSSVAKSEWVVSSGSLFSRELLVKAQPLFKTEALPKSDLHSKAVEPPKTTFFFKTESASKAEPSTSSSALFTKPATPPKGSLFDFGPTAAPGTPGSLLGTQQPLFKTDTLPQSTSLFAKASHKTDPPTAKESSVLGTKSLFKTDALSQTKSLFDTTAIPSFGTGAQSTTPSLFGTKLSGKIDPAVTKDSLFGSQSLFGTDAPAQSTSLFGTKASSEANPSFGEGAQPSALFKFETKAADKIEPSITKESLFGSRLFSADGPSQSTSLFGANASSESKSASGRAVQSGALFSFETKAADMINPPVIKESLFGTRFFSADTLSQSKPLFDTKASSESKPLFGATAQSQSPFAFGTKTPLEFGQSSSLFGSLSKSSQPESKLLFKTDLFSKSEPLGKSEQSSSLFGLPSGEPLFKSQLLFKTDPSSQSESLFSKSGSLFSGNVPITKPEAPLKPLFDTSAFPKTQFVFQTEPSSTLKELPKIESPLESLFKSNSAVAEEKLPKATELPRVGTLPKVESQLKDEAHDTLLDTELLPERIPLPPSPTLEASDGDKDSPAIQATDILVANPTLPEDEALREELLSTKITSPNAKVLPEEILSSSPILEGTDCSPTPLAPCETELSDALVNLNLDEQRKDANTSPTSPENPPVEDDAEPKPQNELLKPTIQIEVHEQELTSEEIEDETTVVEREAEAASTSVVTYDEEGATLVDTQDPLALKMGTLEIVDKLVNVVACAGVSTGGIEGEGPKGTDGVNVVEKELVPDVEVVAVAA
ncbi:Nn.00g013450.m01.CDS01 [Neocucurbitaria sp. VM-36]